MVAPPHPRVRPLEGPQPGHYVLNYCFKMINIAEIRASVPRSERPRDAGRRLVRHFVPAAMRDRPHDRPVAGEVMGRPLGHCRGRQPGPPTGRRHVPLEACGVIPPLARFSQRTGFPPRSPRQRRWGSRLLHAHGSACGRASARRSRAWPAPSFRDRRSAGFPWRR